MALGIFKKAWNTTQLADLTDYFTTFVNSLVTAITPGIVATTMADYILKSDNNNTASGTDTVTINGKSGIIEYSTTISGSASRAYTFTNTSVDNQSIIIFSINYTKVVKGLPYIQSYKISGSTVTINIANSDTSATDANLFLNFLIVN